RLPPAAQPVAPQRRARAAGVRPRGRGDSLMLAPVARVEHPEVHEIVASAHCVARFRQRMPIRTPGAQDVIDRGVGALEEADSSRWPPAWVQSDAVAQWWAATPDLAFPLQRTDRPGRWLAITCLRRSSR